MTILVIYDEYIFWNKYHIYILSSQHRRTLGKGGEREIKDALYPEGKISQENVEINWLPLLK